MIWMAAAFDEYGETWQLMYSKNNMAAYLPSMLLQFIILDIIIWYFRFMFRMCE